MLDGLTLPSRLESLPTLSANEILEAVVGIRDISNTRHSELEFFDKKWRH